MLAQLMATKQQQWQESAKGRVCSLPARGAQPVTKLLTNVTPAGTPLAQALGQGSPELTWGDQSRGQALCHNSPV